MSIINIEHDPKTTINYINSLVGETFTINNEPIEGHKYRYYRLYVNGNTNHYVSILFDDDGILRFCGFSKKCVKDYITRKDSIHEWGKVYVPAGSDKVYFKAFLEYIHIRLSKKRHLYSYVIEFIELVKNHLSSNSYRYYVEDKNGNLRLIDYDIAIKLILSGEFNRIDHDGFTMLMLK